jgi:hypothetical protein
MTQPSHLPWSPGTVPTTTGQALPRSEPVDDRRMTVTAPAAERLAQARQAQQQANTASNNEVVGQIYELTKAVRAAQVSWNQRVERESEGKDENLIRSELAAFADTPEAQSLGIGAQAIDAWVTEKQTALQQERENLSQYGEEGRERRDRAWAAAQRRIDVAQADPSGKSTVQVIREIIQRARPDELPVLVDQVPAYAESLGFPVGFIEAEIAAKVPSLGEKQRDLRNAERDATVCRHAIGAVQRGISKGHPVPPEAIVDPAAVANRVGDVGAAVR